jgi:hypothetical protein
MPSPWPRELILMGEHMDLSSSVPAGPCLVETRGQQVMALESYRKREAELTQKKRRAAP